MSGEDSHDDFKPKYKAEPASDVNSTIENDINSHDVFIYMKVCECARLAAAAQQQQHQQECQAVIVSTYVIPASLVLLSTCSGWLPGYVYEGGMALLHACQHAPMTLVYITSCKLQSRQWPSQQSRSRGSKHPLCMCVLSAGHP